ncbi:hypothetical protein J2I47_09345 [Fibrella sp. HMF5335]|uniref:Uncharacterized protein n=1 Tax=Fibrella rubiginis TaxID=2817060 RepID=A0A939K503_9BACT|nr:hypothetical protein [Fibrella rubiginis]MBO0936746.1 hypothetical protein [Fibrella rubiginis]
MENTFDFEAHFRRLEHANGEELVTLEQQLHTYLNESVEDAPTRKLAFNTFLGKQIDKGHISLETIRELLAQAVEA